MITLKNLDFSYKKSAVFKNISLEFKEGNVYGLLGENGVGKTTLLKIISGLQFPNNGTCMVDDFIPSERNPYFLQNIFYLPEETSVKIRQVRHTDTPACLGSRHCISH